MAKITGYAKQSNPKWLYVLGGILFLLFVLFMIYGLGVAVNRQAEKKEEKKPFPKTSTSSSTPVSTTIRPAKDLKAITKANEALPISGTGKIVEKIILTSKINEQNLPSDELKNIFITQGKLYCYTRIVSAKVPKTISHLWIDPAGNIFANVKLNIHNQPADTWSFINLSGGGKGEWQVEVRDADGRKLEALKFLVQ